MSDRDHTNEHQHAHDDSRMELIFTFACGICLVVGWLLPKLSNLANTWVGLVPLLFTYFFGGVFTAKEAYESIRHGKFQIDSLMLVAAIGAAILGKWLEGGLLLFLFNLGHSLEHYAMAKATGAIESLAHLTPDEATIVRDDVEQVVAVSSLDVGDIVRVRPDERIPVDGFVFEGHSSVNQAPVTGESVPVDKYPVDDVNEAKLAPHRIDKAHQVFAGTINGAGALMVCVTKRSDESALARVAQMVAEAQKMRSPTQQFTDKFERYFVPSILCFVILLCFAPLVRDESFAQSFYRAMAVLVAASPCALAIATPSAVLSGIAAAGQSGVLVKGGAPLENLGGLTAFAFDKTGTLTKGQPQVVTVESYASTEISELLAIATATERLSDHPIAKAVALYGEKELGNVPYQASDMQSITGQGVMAYIDEKLVLIGNETLFDQQDRPQLPEQLRHFTAGLKQKGQTLMIVCWGQQFLGVIGLMDTPRQESTAVIERLRKLGINQMIMLSGDNQSVADSVAQQVGLDEVHGDLMPDDKVHFIKRMSQDGAIAMVGDGVNDAPAMAAATVSIAMGAAGSDTALETADIALMSDELSKLPYIVSLSRKTRSIIRQNLWLSLGMVVFLIPATLLGLQIGPAVALHEGSTLIVVANALRLLAFRDDVNS